MRKNSIFRNLVAKNILASTNKNRLQILGAIDLSMYGGTSWVQTIQSLGKRVGKKKVFSYGCKMGESVAKEFNAALKRKKAYLPKSLFLVDNVIQLAGFGVVKTRVENSSNKVFLSVVDNKMLDLAAKLCGANPYLGTFYAGIYSALIRHFMKIPKCELVYAPQKKIQGTKHQFKTRQ